MGLFELIFDRIAKLNDLQEFSNVNTETVATLQYMAPEAMSQSVYTTKSDIYAFSIVAYEILFERNAFGTLDGFQFIDSVVNKNLRPKLKEGISPDLGILLTQCWSQIPDERPTAQEICKKMMKILKKNRKKK